MKRRDFVKGLAAAQVAMMAAQVGCTNHDGTATPSGDSGRGITTTPSDGAPQQLNVVVHGTFAIVVDRKAAKPRVYLKAPKVDGHLYRAQTFKIDAGNPNNLIDGWNQGDYDARANATDTVDFDRGGPANLQHLRIGEDARVAVDLADISEGDNPYWTIALPLPDDIWPFRATPFNYFDDTGGATDTYHANEMHFSQQCPLIYVLTYNQLKANATVHFSGNKLDVPFVAGIGRLHFFAEPVGNCEGGNPGHLRTALKALDNLFKPALKLSLASTSDPDTAQGFDSTAAPCFKNHPSVLQCEERSLEERKCYTCSQIQSQPTIEAQYASAVKFMNDLKRIQEQSLTMSDKRAGKMKSQTTTVIVPALKPPSNCMSLIAIQS
jgi:hypothetical protein